jgi:hypothetical protein
MTRARYRIRTLRGSTFEDEKDVLAHLETARRTKAGKPESLIRKHGNWPSLDLSDAMVARYEKRDAREMQEAASRRARGEKLPCPLVRYTGEFEANAFGRRDEIRISARVQTPQGTWAPGGHLTASLSNGHFVVDAVHVPFRILSGCPGVGHGFYEAAQKLACKHGTTIAGSNVRSPFAQRFWQKQVEKGRARCAPKGAGVYTDPLEMLVSDLEAGRVTVPQYNDLVRRLPPRPPNDEWPCSTVPLLSCETATLRGLKKRRRSR